MPPLLENLEIRGIRGIRNSTLELRGRSLLVLGENGSGKSSLVDALELLFTGRIGHLAGARPLSTRTHGKHVDVAEADARVIATFRAPEGSVSRGLSGSAEVGHGLETAFQALAEGGFILRRSHLLQFVVAAPSERSRALEGLMGIQDLDKVELGLLKERDALRGELESGRAEASRQLSELAHAAQLPASEATPLQQFVNPALLAAGFPAVESDEAIVRIGAEAPTMVGSSGALDRLRSFASLEQSLIGSGVASEVVSDVRASLEEVRRVNRDTLRQASREVQLLQQGNEVLLAEALEACPLCEQPVSRAALLSRLRERIQQGVELTATASRIRTRASSLSTTLERSFQSTEEAKSKAEQLGGLDALVTALGDRAALLSRLKESVFALGDLRALTELEPLLTEVPGSEAVVSQGVAQCRSLVAGIQGSAVLHRSRALELVQRAKRLLSQRSKLESLEHSLWIAETCALLVSTSKREAVSSLYADVRSEVARLYSRIHPAEPHGEVSLELDPEQRASTELRMTSFGQSAVDPRAYSSEGHLDTLGLCIFLALFSRIHSGAPLLVLDDVLTTLDATHRQRIAEMLLEEFRGKQLLVTTHDGIWYHELLGVSVAQRRRDGFLAVRIAAWSRGGGPDFRPYKTRPERIRDWISAGDIEVAGNEARRYLEAVSQEICERTEAPVAYRSDNRHDPGPLFEAAAARTSSLVQDSGFRASLEDRVSAVRSTAFMGNLLSHANVEGAAVSSGDLTAFVDAVVAWSNILCCQGCGTRLQYARQVRTLGCPKSDCPSRTSIPTH